MGDIMKRDTFQGNTCNRYNVLVQVHRYEPGELEGFRYEQLIGRDLSTALHDIKKLVYLREGGSTPTTIVA